MNDAYLTELETIHSEATMENVTETLDKQIAAALREYTRDIMRSGKPCPCCGRS